MICGKTIELEMVADLPEGQAVEVDISLLGAPAAMARDPDPSQDDVMRVADETQQRITERLGGNLNLSVDYIREDRD